MRRQLRTPPRSRYVQGPASVLDRFVAYADQLKADLAFRSLDRARAVDIIPIMWRVLKGCYTVR
jgi:hypothetical protein